MENKTVTKKSNKKIVMAMLCYILCPITILVLFQNCGSKPNSGSNTFSSLDTGDLIVQDDDDDDDDLPHLRRVQVNQMVANRVLLANYFTDIFGPDIETTVAALIANQPSDFGSSNSIYDRIITTTCGTKKSIYAPCSTADVLQLDTKANVGVNIRREAFRVRSCHTAVKNRTLIALKKIDSTATATKIPAINEANLKKAFSLFFRARRAPSSEVVDALTIVSQKEAKPLDQWKDVMLSLCLSPHWQVL
ncbi:MAG: hypothetical protein IT287_08605 [Bdellovibrionaceae bacterium]|nr:hypothetical protein [Pseudobdellovibrionaceae bacterium]